MLIPSWIEHFCFWLTFLKEQLELSLMYIWFILGYHLHAAASNARCIIQQCQWAYKKLIKLSPSSLFLMVEFLWSSNCLHDLFSWQQSQLFTETYLSLLLKTNKVWNHISLINYQLLQSTIIFNVNQEVVPFFFIQSHHNLLHLTKLSSIFVK